MKAVNSQPLGTSSPPACGYGFVAVRGGRTTEKVTDGPDGRRRGAPMTLRVPRSVSTPFIITLRKGAYGDPSIVR